MKHEVRCPKCGSSDIRFSRKRERFQGLRGFMGVHRFRCRGCGKRFEGRIWHLALIGYAKCPKCAGLELEDWQEKYHYPHVLIRSLRYVGGRQQRCRSCRHNFVSFRPRWPGEKENGSK